MTTRTKTMTLELTDGRRESLVLMSLENTADTMVEYRSTHGERFEYSSAELIAAGYSNVPEFLVVRAVYVLQPSPKVKK